MSTTEVAPRSLSIAIALAAATVGVIYGYDTRSIAGALLFIPDHFNLSTNATEWVATVTGLGSSSAPPPRTASPTRSAGSSRWS